MRKILQKLAVNLLAFSGLPYVLSIDDGKKLRVYTAHKELSEADKNLVIAVIARFYSELQANASDTNVLSIVDEPKVEHSEEPIWKPKFGDRYYGIFKFNGKLMITRYDIWTGNLNEEAQYKCGWVFKTREYAELALPSIARELGIEYEI